MKKIISIGFLLLQINLLYSEAIPEAQPKTSRHVTWADQQAQPQTPSFAQFAATDGIKTTGTSSPQHPAVDIHNLTEINMSNDQSDNNPTGKSGDIVIDSNGKAIRPQEKSPAIPPKNKFLAKIFRPAKPLEIRTPEIQIDKIDDTNTLSVQDFNFIKDFMRNARKFAVDNGILQEHTDSLGSSYDASLPDTQAINNRIRNFDKATRSVMKSTLGKIKKLEISGDLTFAQKKEIAESLIQSQINTILGTDSMTGEIKFSFTKEIQNKLVNQVLQDPTFFDATERDAIRLQKIAAISDAVMNEFANGDPVNGMFTTSIEEVTDDSGKVVDINYIHNMSSIIESTDGKIKNIQTQTTVNNDGQTTGRILTVDNGDGIGQVNITTIIDPKTKKSSTVMTRPVSESYVDQDPQATYFIKDGQRWLTKTLTSAESKMTNLQFALHQSLILGRLMLKVSLWSTKQIAWNLINHPIPSPILIGSILPLAMLVKSGAKLAGYEQSDPTILATFGTVVDMTMGSRRSILSNSPDRVFTKGSTIANALNYVNPLGKKEDYIPDENEEYFGAEAEIGKGIMYGLKTLFPDKFGDRLISLDNLNPVEKVPVETAKKPTANTTLADLQNKMSIENSDQLAQHASQQFDQAKLEFNQDIFNHLTTKSKFLVGAENVIGQNAAQLLVDTNATVQRLATLDVKTRDTTLKILNLVDTAATKKSIVGKYQATSLLSSNEADLAAHKQNIVKTLIQSQVDNVFGVNQLSGQSIYKLTPEAQAKLEEDFTTQIDTLFDPSKTLQTHEKLQIIANMSDAIMNKLATDVDGSNPVARFTTTFLADGTYKTRISNNAGITSEITIDASNNTTNKILTINDKKNNPTIVFTTTIANGTTKTMLDDETGITKTLMAQDASFVDIAHDQLRAMANSRSMIKATLWAGKQIVICLIPMPASIATCLTIAAISPIVIKGGSLAMGYKFSDPVVRTALMTTMELTMGNKRGLLSADPNRVFSKGTIGSKIANSFTTGKISESFAEQRDPNEEYYHSLDDAVVDTGLEAYNWLFSTKVINIPKASTVATI